MGIQKPAPEFSATAVVDGEFKQISLDDYKGQWLVLFFYPLDFTFVCPTEIIAFSERVEEFKAIGCEGIALRGLFIINPEGVVEQVTVNNLPVGRSVDETLRLVKAFQFVAENGEVCPAGWSEGSATIVPEVGASKNYFEN